MSEVKDGGPAFPQVDVKDAHGMLVPDRQAGMTLRDYFAAKVMHAIVSRGVVKDISIETYAENAYRVADIMLKARMK